MGMRLNLACKDGNLRNAIKEVKRGAAINAEDSNLNTPSITQQKAAIKNVILNSNGAEVNKEMK